MPFKPVTNERQRQLVLKATIVIFILSLTAWLGFQAGNSQNDSRVPQIAAANHPADSTEEAATPTEPAALPIKEKTSYEELVPEEARQTIDVVSEKVPEVLGEVKQEGRTNYEMRQLKEDVLILKAPQEQLIANIVENLQGYLKNVISLQDEVSDRLKKFQTRELQQFIYEQISAGRLLHPQTRTLANQIENQPRSTPNSFYEPDKLNSADHPLQELRQRLVKQDLRRADLFFLIESFRLAQNDNRDALALTATLDQLTAQLKQSASTNSNSQATSLVARLIPESYREQIDQFAFAPGPLTPIACFQPTERDLLGNQRERLYTQVEQLIPMLALPDHEFGLAVNIEGEETFYFHCLVLEEQSAIDPTLQTPADPQLEQAVREILQGEQLVSMGRIELGLQKLKSATETFSLSPVRLRYFAQLALLHGDEQAVQQFVPDFETRPSPDNYRTFLARSVLLRRQNQIAEAETILKRCLGVALREPEMHLAMGLLQVDQQDFAAAAKSLERAKRLSQRDRDKLESIWRHSKRQEIIARNSKPQDRLNSVPTSLETPLTYESEQERFLTPEQKQVRFDKDRRFFDQQLRRGFILPIFSN